MSSIPPITLVLGGAASGKSAFAEGLVTESNRARTYLATARIFDAEMRAKVDAHRAMRGPDWDLVECPFDVAGALAKIDADRIVLLDCATMWLSNHMLAEHDIAAQTDALITGLRTAPAPVVIVSNETGQGIVPDNALARKFRQAQGELNQRLAAVSDRAALIVAGLPLVLKGAF